MFTRPWNWSIWLQWHVYKSMQLVHMTSVACLQEHATGPYDFSGMFTRACNWSIWLQWHVYKSMQLVHMTSVACSREHATGPYDFSGMFTRDPGPCCESRECGSHSLAQLL
jgi:hypothetical protein